MLRNSGFKVWLLLSVLLLGLLNLPSGWSFRIKGVVRETSAPLQLAVVFFLNRLGEAMDAFRGRGGLWRENQEMSAELVRLRSRLRLLEELERENVTLRRHLGFVHTTGGGVTACEVVGRDASGWWETVRLAKGALHGLRPQQAVITPDGLVGRIREVTPRTADVLLISDPSFRMSALISRPEAYGIVSGRGADVRGRPLCRIDFINRDVPIRPGDEVVSSGLGGVFARGLPIGYIERVEKDESGLYQYADILLHADLSALNYVLVVTDEPTEEDLLRQRLQEHQRGLTR